MIPSYHSQLPLASKSLRRADGSYVIRQTLFFELIIGHSLCDDALRKKRKRILRPKASGGSRVISKGPRHHRWARSLQKLQSLPARA